MYGLNQLSLLFLLNTFFFEQDLVQPEWARRRRVNLILDIELEKRPL